MLPENKPAEEYSLHNLFGVNLFVGLTCVVYRLPGQKHASFAAGDLLKVEDEIIPGTCFLVSGFSKENSIYALSQKWFQRVKKFERIEGAEVDFPVSEKALPATIEKAFYVENVRKAVNEIDSGKLEKVVLSRTKKILLPGSFSAINLFIELTEKYPDAFVYLLMSKELGNWVAATPELLLQVENSEIKTVALAGTRHICTSGKMPSAGDFNRKEEHEQDVVTNYITEVLHPFTDNLKISSAQITRAGNLFHLQTSFSGNLQEKYIKNWLPLLKKLHPTPAVAGIPLAQSQQFIDGNELYNRSLYSGFLGPVDEEKNAQLFVNLRCMQFNKKEAVLYVGAGIVNGSEPEKEWQETEDKLRTLLDVLEI